MPHGDIYELTVYFSFDSKVYSDLCNRILFGHLCWGLRWKYGVAKLREFLQSLKEDGLRLALSDPRPCDKNKKNTSVLSIVGDKSLLFKKRNFHVTKTNVLKLQCRLSQDPVEIDFIRQAHVNLQGVESKLYWREYFVSQNPFCFEIQCSFANEEQKHVWFKLIKEAIELGLTLGYGGKISSGAGHVILQRMEENQYPQVLVRPEIPYVALGYFLPQKSVFSMAKDFAYDHTTWLGWSQLGWSYPKMMLLKSGSWFKFKSGPQVVLSELWSKPYFYQDCCVLTAAPLVEVEYA